MRLADACWNGVTPLNFLVWPCHSLIHSRSPTADRSKILATSPSYRLQPYLGIHENHSLSALSDLQDSPGIPVPYLWSSPYTHANPIEYRLRVVQGTADGNYARWL
jgi:hypothetical protein